APGAERLGASENCDAPHGRTGSWRASAVGTIPGLLRGPFPLVGMNEPSSRRLLDVEIPAQPEVLVKLSLLLAEDDVDLHAASRLISSDMALAAAVLKTVNSAMYGLRGRVQSVQQAITYLGTREVASVTFAMGLRAVFPP